MVIYPCPYGRDKGLGNRVRTPSSQGGGNRGVEKILQFLNPPKDRMGIAARTFLRDGAFHMDTVCRNVCRILQLDANRYSR